MHTISISCTLLLLVSAFIVFILKVSNKGAHIHFGFRQDAAGDKDLLLGLLLPLVAVLLWLLVAAAFGIVKSISYAGPSFTLLTETGGTFFLAALEEFLVRSLFLSLLLYLLKKEWLALLISALVFGGAHAGNPGADAISLLSNTLGGLIYGLAFIKTRSLLLPVLLHFSWNWYQGNLLGIQVSGYQKGGLFCTELVPLEPWFDYEYGPEGGLGAIGIRLVTLAMLLYFLARR